eukprot:1150147-Pelagomonas_calceolata.AAC.3
MEMVEEEEEEEEGMGGGGMDAAAMQKMVGGDPLLHEQSSCIHLCQHNGDGGGSAGNLHVVHCSCETAKLLHLPSGMG